MFALPSHVEGLLFVVSLSPTLLLWSSFLCGCAAFGYGLECVVVVVTDNYIVKSAGGGGQLGRPSLLLLVLLVLVGRGRL